jgi:hypothetical protein
MMLAVLCFKTVAEAPLAYAIPAKAVRSLEITTPATRLLPLYCISKSAHLYLSRGRSDRNRHNRSLGRFPFARTLCAESGTGCACADSHISRGIRRAVGAQ